MTAASSLRRVNAFLGSTSDFLSTQPPPSLCWAEGVGTHPELGSALLPCSVGAPGWRSSTCPGAADALVTLLCLALLFPEAAAHDGLFSLRTRAGEGLQPAEVLSGAGGDDQCFCS